ncbi:hypothetical protein SAMN06265348_103137 [Pedobacter westerhofensis]|uniref:DUF5723 domain-containing protein n=1 Tax=Pedobacter westerhofensis TaxID=425512 RepID=A0A521C166_9SPHI|nr:DUF5723 family protein [Pedobacter westerhofensis]SMO53189.1 hypothetical protein SAMN06265348_103137 [Pedobacter westerhofensis]
MAKICVYIGLLLISSQLQAQQFGLFNTNTLFDAFENPAQRAFTSDDSRQYASNFLFPTGGFNTSNRGDASYTLQRKLNDGFIDTKNIPVGMNNRNKLYGGSNVYLLTFRMSPFYQNNKELGFSWQIRSDAYANYTNETLVALRNYGRFSTSKDDLFNGDGYGQSYHQFSANYRVDYGDGIAVGLKVGVLSGITYNNADVTQSGLTVSPDHLSVRLTGKYKASFLLTEELDRNTLLPDFKNPGLSVSLGTTYRSASDVFIMANLKDLGFIRWNKNSSSVVLNNDLIVLNAGTAANSKELQRKVVDLLKLKNQRGAFYTATNAKVDFLISKTYNFYTPDLIISKNLFYNGADVVLVNNFKVEEFTISVTPAFNMNQFLLFGVQGLYQTANFELFAGTDNLLKSAVIFNDASYSPKGVIGASLYLGVGIKFGHNAERR